jgi:hypothetical protein
MMPRKRTTKDFAITMDEFHPRPSTAAAFADRKANDATQDHLMADLKRVTAKAETTTDDGERIRLHREKNRLGDLLAQAREDRKAIDTRIQEAKVA